MTRRRHLLRWLTAWAVQPVRRDHPYRWSDDDPLIRSLGAIRLRHTHD